MIEIKHDHKLQFPPIKVPRYNEDNEEGPDIYKQTDIEGVLVPLIRFNDITITFEMVDKMTLTCDPMPYIDIKITDFMELIRILDQPGHDNILYLQILPPFDDAYKKIQLAFYMDNISIVGQSVSMSGRYYVPKLYDTVMKPYGIITSYKLFEQVSNDYSLGFCSNVEDTQDERYIYNPNKSIEWFLEDEIGFTGEKEHVYTWWIDFWNNINFVDLFKEYTELTPEDKMLIWVTDNFKDTDDAPEPRQQIAAFTNHPAFAASPTFIHSYKPVLNASPVTDKNFEIYSMDDQEASSTLIQDGDVHNDIFTQYEYGGEKFGEFDYLSQKACRNMFLNKINSQCIEVVSTHPLIALMKGDHVNLWWYDMGSELANAADNTDVHTNAPVPEVKETMAESEDVQMVLNKTVSGQYYIIDIEYKYIGHRNWEVKYTLSRSAEEIQKLSPPTKETFIK